MDTYKMYAIAISVYVGFLLALAAVIFMVEDEDLRMMAMAALSSGLMVVTMILALVFLRGSNSERYKELYMSEEKKDE